MAASIRKSTAHVVLMPALICQCAAVGTDGDSTELLRLPLAPALILMRRPGCAGTACKPYAALFEEGAWKELAELFRKDLYRLHSMPLDSQLSIHLQVTTRITLTPTAVSERRLYWCARAPMVASASHLDAQLPCACLMIR